MTTYPLLKRTFFSLFWLLILTGVRCPGQNGDSISLNNHKIPGYRGIWFELNQKYPYGDKYSGGLGTYTAKHIPLAIYDAKAGKTFFVYGGTPEPGSRHLLCMIGSYDHKKGVVAKPTVVFDKMGVNDPHDNPSLLIDGDGYLWVFVSGRGRSRPGHKLRSTLPYDISHFDLVSSEEMTYPQPWFIENAGMIHLFTKYTGIRELYFETSADGYTWSRDIKLAGIRSQCDSLGGHYQVSNFIDNKVATFFNRHPQGHPDHRTDLYYLQTTDFGKTWTTAEGYTVNLPVSEVKHPSRVMDYASQNKNVYLKDLNFDESGNPVCLYLTSSGHEPGPGNAPYEWHLARWNGGSWEFNTLFSSDHNYDMGSLYISKEEWMIVAPTLPGPFPYSAGGEIMIWQSDDRGSTWHTKKQVTSNSTLNHTYVRRPLNATDPFLYFWADGNPRSLSISHLYFGNSVGKYWQLPYEMKSRPARPEKQK